MTDTQHTRLALKDIKPSPSQPRKHFDQKKLHELAVSIGPPEATKNEPAGRGVIVPVIVRPVNGHYELVAGERRVRASEIAGWSDVPAVIVKMTDAEVAETQLIENSQRDDITALEEAEHYNLLIKKFGHTHDTIAAKVGKARSYVYARLGLLKLGPVAKKALADGKLQPAIATDLVTTVGDPKLQEQYVRECLGEKLDYKEQDALEQVGIQHELLGAKEDDGEYYPPDANFGEDRQPLSYRAARELLRRKYSTRLALAKFDLHDDKLTKAGACGPCPHRSGNQLDLLGIGAKQADDVCTKPSCFADKTQAAWAIQAKEAEKRGAKIVERDDAKNVFFDSGDIKPTSPYVDPEDDLPADLARAGSKATWAKLLGKRFSEVPRALVQDITGAPRELLVKSKAVEVLRELGKIDKPEKPKKSSSSSSSSSTSYAQSDEYKKEQEKREREREITAAALKAFLAKVADAKIGEKKELALWRFVAKVALRDQYYDMEAVAERYDVDDRKLVDLVDKAKTVQEVQSLFMQCALCLLHDSHYKPEKDAFEDGCKIVGVDWDAVVDEAKAVAKEQAKVEAAAAKEAKKADDEKKDEKAPAKKVAAKKSKKKGGKK